MKVKVNGEEIEIPDGSTIREAIKISDALYEDGCVLGVIKGKEEFERHVNKYKIKTTKGSIIIELLEDAPIDLVETWKRIYKKLEDLRIRWTSSSEVSLGPLKTELVPSKEEYTYNRWDVVMSLSGFSADATHIILNKEKHAAVYGAPADNHGIFARVIGGKRTIMKLTDEDYIKNIKPVVERKSIVNSAAITDLDTIITEGNEIFTYVKVILSDKSPQSAEQFFSLSEDGKIKVDYESDSFIGLYDLQGLEKDPEFIDQRRRGTITLRNIGKGVGRIYIYREDRVSTPSHNLVGHVEKGMELVDISRYQDYLTVKTEPERLMVMSMTQKKADDYLNNRGVQQIRKGVTDDNAIVVEQYPRYSLEILKEAKVETLGISPDELIYVNLNDASPRSSWYFRKVTGLLDAPVGFLKVHFAFPGMKVMMFEGQSKEAKGIVPENSPENCVKAGEIGITNMSRRHIGMIGVRFEDNDEFGPTGEPFNGTNIIGKIVKGLNNLEKFKEGDIVYVAEK
ncbi:MAG: methanogenesis marker 3 protein [Methanobacteriaceae archaeon]|nr:methanogenesis marker 3 protein [Methanobacteriaceae archaeon]